MIDNAKKEVKRLDKQYEIIGNKMGQLIVEGWEASRTGKKKIGWSTAVFPNFLLSSFDMIMFYPEAESSDTCMRDPEAATKFLAIAQGAGYSRDICPYAGISFGKMLGNATMEEGGTPPPDFLITARTVCCDYPNWFEELARLYNVPLFVFDQPFNNSPGVPMDHHVQYWKEQCRGLINFLEEQTGQKFDEQKYRKGIENEIVGAKLIKEMFESSQHVPSPVSEWDVRNPLMLYLQNDWTLDLLKELKAEIDERTGKNISAIPRERHRFMFVSNQIFHRMEKIPQWLAELDSVFVASALTVIFSRIRLKEGDSIEDSLATFFKVFGNLGIEETTAFWEQVYHDWKCDGVVFLNNRGCKMMALPAYEMMAEFEKKSMPCLMIEGNMCDPRDFDEERVKEQFKNFIELLDQRET
jgi:benzoyl-CoA reductase/2-hydroxyglutaryl-CoA dehydratase subunit BcrC/BadD/HgdB